MATDVDVDDFLEHFGVKGMRWGHRKAPSSSSDGPAAPTRKELRGMNKVARAGQRADAKQKAVDNDNAIKEARARRKDNYNELKTAKKQYKNDKKQIGRVAAKQVLRQNQEKPLKDLEKASELTRKEQNTKLLIDVSSILLKSLG